MGSCPRCRGELRFLDDAGVRLEPEDRAVESEPAAVLGTPTSWAR